MRISDDGNGITRDSLAFYRDHRHEIGELREVTVRFPGYDDPFDPYLLVLRDTAGAEMRLSGCTAGYVGEGPNGTMRILIEEGIPVADAVAVLSVATARYVRSADGWSRRECTLATARDSTPCELVPPGQSPVRLAPRLDL